jgi:hypothetical protein
MQPHGLDCPMVKRMPKKKVLLHVESWVFTFFQNFLLLMVVHNVIFNVTLHFECKVFKILRKFYKFHGARVLSQDPHLQCDTPL